MRWAIIAGALTLGACSTPDYCIWPCVAGWDGYRHPWQAATPMPPIGTGDNTILTMPLGRGWYAHSGAVNGMTMPLGGGWSVTTFE